MDLFSHKMVGLAMESHLATDLVEGAFHRALVERQPEAGVLHHSDRGSQYTRDRYLTLLDGYQMRVSRSDTGQGLDNAPMESFWGTLKTEGATEPFATRQQARSAIFAYITIWYNRQRRHSALGYLSPEQFEQLHRVTFS
jgi:transposase InsO family protein